MFLPRKLRPLLEKLVVRTPSQWLVRWVVKRVEEEAEKLSTVLFVGKRSTLRQPEVVYPAKLPEILTVWKPF